MADFPVPSNSYYFPPACSSPRQRGREESTVSGAPLPPLIPHGDQAVQETTDEAASSKLSAVNHGYFQDECLQHFVRRSTRRPPLINRGYYCRVEGIRQVARTFFESPSLQGKKRQIVDLGAGLDTLSFWSLQNSDDDLIFYEVDFPEVVSRKTSIIMRKDCLWSRIADRKEDITTRDGCQLISRRLRLVSVDMRQIDRLGSSLEAAGFKRDQPTLFVAECVLVYMMPSESDQLIQWASTAVDADSSMVVYEQINPLDSFGRTMIKNLETRGCPLLSLPKYPTIQSQKERYHRLGWDRCSINDMNEIYDKGLTLEERNRIQRLEIFDEIEEWRLIQAHYILAVAAKWQKHTAIAKEDGHKSDASSEGASSLSPPQTAGSPAGSAPDSINGNAVEHPLQKVMDSMESRASGHQAD